MARKSPFALIYALQVIGHLHPIESRFHSLIRKTIEQRLRFEPDVESRNRKPLKRQLFEADWELRFGHGNRFRAFYKVNHESRTVEIAAIGVKKGNRLVVGGEEVEL